MRLRKECVHGKFDSHFPPNEDLPGWELKYPQMGYERETKGWFWCPGGEFLPEDALVIEKVDVDDPECGDCDHLPRREWPEWVNSYRLRLGGTTAHLLDALSEGSE